MPNGKSWPQIFCAIICMVGLADFLMQPKEQFITIEDREPYEANPKGIVYKYSSDQGTFYLYNVLEKNSSAMVYKTPLFDVFKGGKEMSGKPLEVHFSNSTFIFFLCLGLASSLLFFIIKNEMSRVVTWFLSLLSLLGSALLYVTFQ